MRCRVSILFPALLSALLLCRNGDLTLVCLLASLVHEIGHLLTMLLLHVPPKECVVGLFGLRIQLTQHITTYPRNVMIALAGPLANGLAAGFLWWFGASQAAMVHLWLAILNLLPITVLDGGEILRGLVGLCGGNVDAFLHRCSIGTTAFIIVNGLWIMVRHSGTPTLFIVGCYLAMMLFFSNKNEKTS